jgi:HK97 family phage major capsid protein
MGAYLDRLHGEFDEITGGISALVERAAEESRDLTNEENTQVEREDKRRDDLLRAIEHHTALEERTNKVAAARGRVQLAPTMVRTRERDKDPYDIVREFPTPADYVIAVHDARVKRDPGAIEKLERATANQVTTVNPGIVPRPVVGPLLNTMSSARPLVSSVQNRPAPAGKFDRPRVDQHVEVGPQTAEKDLTASQQMLINPVAVSLVTFAGHLDISLQDIRWSQPGIMQVVFDDFTRIYARRTDNQACVDFVAAAPDGAALSAWTAAAVEAWLRAAVTSIGTATGGGGLADTLWMSSDVWANLGGILQGTSGVKAYSLPLTGGGDVLGLRAVIDPQFAAKTLIIGDAALAEFWEELEGFLSVGEPSVLGQMVGYAGYSKFVVVEPKGFSQATALAGDVTGTEADTTSDSGSTSSKSSK